MTVPSAEASSFRRNALASYFIDRPIFATVLAIATMLAGVMGIYSLSISQYPDIAPVTVRISATYTGATAEAVENSVTKKIESALRASMACFTWNRHRARARPRSH